MTRFNITIDQGVDMVLYALEHAIGGEMFIPKIPSYHILDVAKAVCPNCKIEEVGIRPGEKLHEEMITVADSLNTIETDKYYITLPVMPEEKKKMYLRYYNAKEVPEGFSYNSADNNEWITIEELRKQIKEYVDPNFEVQ
jgi:UDP-N-acetylglucosamine 4,6-dehydratase